MHATANEEKRPRQIFELKISVSKILPVDVTSQISVGDAAAEIERSYGRLDILVNNAGIALDWHSGLELTMDVLQETFETNVFGVFRVTKAMLPLLKKSKRGRIVDLTSGNGSFGFFTNPAVSLPDRCALLAYASSKAATEYDDGAISESTKGIWESRSMQPIPVSRRRIWTSTAEHEWSTTWPPPVRLALRTDDGPTGGVFGNVVPSRGDPDR